MRFGVVIHALCLFAGSMLAGSPAGADPLPEILHLQEQVHRHELNARLQHLESYGTRFVSSSQAPLVVDYILSELVDYGWEAEFQEFSFEHDTLGTVTSWNVVGSRAGTDPDALVVIGAHWDSVNDSPGGSWDNPEAPAPGVGDNGSGVAVLLELARVLRYHSFRQNVEIVFFGAEEQRQQGSKVYVEEHLAAGTNIAGFYNVDTVSYDIDETWDFSVLSDHASLWLMWDAINVCHEYTPELWPIDIYVPEEWSDSDAYYFWVYHYPAISIWEGVWWNPEEHGQHGDTAEDTYANSVPDDGAFLTAMTRFALSIFCVWADLGDTPSDVADIPLQGKNAIQVFPNPFRETTSIRLQRAESGAAPRLEIFDIRGRRVRVLAPAADGMVLWDGRDESGAVLAAGIYLLRDSSPGSSSRKQIVLVR